MTTRLRKPVTRVVEISGDLWNVTLDYAGVTFRAYRGRLSITLPYPGALARAAWLDGGTRKRKQKVRRSAL